MADLSQQALPSGDKPMVLEQRIETLHASYTLFVPKDLSFFRGHFPDYPIVPGVSQIDWAVYYSQRDLRLNSNISSMENIKFKRPIGPDFTLSLRLSLLPGDNGISFHFFDEQGSFSSGKLFVGQPRV